MIQRISVRAIVTLGHKTLLLKRADGRDSILGKFELPGGRVYENEQPEDALLRYLQDDVGIEKVEPGLMSLVDAMTYRDADDRGIQYAVVVYEVKIATKQRIYISEHYSKYKWYQAESFAVDELTELTKIVLGTSQPTPVTDDKNTTFSKQKRTVEAIVYSDGGSRGNPGPSAAGYVIVDANGAVIDQGGEYLGVTTNNQAEYHGVKVGLEAALAKGFKQIEFRVDSMLIVNQLNNRYVIKNRELWPINERVQELIAQFTSVKFQHVPRESNRLADAMVNKVLDDEKRKDIQYNKEVAR